MSRFRDDLWLLDGFSDRTIESYEADVLAFGRWLENSRHKHLTDAKLDDIQGWFSTLIKRGIKASSQARYLASLRKFYGYLMQQGEIRHDPTLALAKPILGRPLPRVPSRETIESLLTVRNLNSIIGLRDKALLELLYATGLRASEISGLVLGNIDTKSRVIRLIGKGGHERVVIYGEEAGFWLDLYLSRSRPALRLNSKTSCVFLTARGRDMSPSSLRQLVIRRAIESLGVDHGITTHSLRHAFATHLLEEGAGIEIIQALLGHASISTTQIYTSVAVSERHRIHGAHPRDPRVKSLPSPLPAPTRQVRSPLLKPIFKLKTRSKKNATPRGGVRG